ncbi:hypothetical protein EJ110_NYTH39077 [Nymphaea thermarum]|nr:hypothetical protein EJ110_NYTH39077 [Nymphaea thermarum]
MAVLGSDAAGANSAMFVHHSGDLLGPSHLEWPFGRVDIDDDDLRETAYEIFFTSCRASPGFGGRTPLTYIGVSEGAEAGGPGGRAPGSTVVPTSRLKRALGLKSRRQSPKRVPAMAPGAGSGGVLSPVKNRRPFTTAELMRQQMRVSEQSDGRLRKALMRILVGQMGRRSETIILPLELLRQLKPSEFNDAHEYHEWQRRHLRVLELGLLTHPSIPLDRSNSSAQKLKEIIRAGELKPIDTGKNSEILRVLCNSVVTLAWRTSNGSPTDICHWVDGFPINLHLYISLLQACFDTKDETMVIEEVDEILELMKKTWTTLGINRSVHNVCFTWVLFQQFVTTGQIEQDLLGAALTLLSEVANDAKKATDDSLYFKILSSALASMQSWAERWLLDYHESFKKGPAGLIENVLPLALSAAKILDGGPEVASCLSEEQSDSLYGRVDAYIRSSARNAFAKSLLKSQILEHKTLDSIAGDGEIGTAEILIVLAKETEDLAKKEKENFSPVLKKWHPVCAGVAAASLHNCYGVVLKQYLNNFSELTKDTAMVLQTAGKLEKLLVQMAVEDSADCEDGGKGIIREMIPYESESIMMGLFKSWIDGRMSTVGEHVSKAKDTETWNPKSKSEPHAQSAAELVRLAREMVDQFFEMPVNVTDDMVQHLTDGLDAQFQGYIAFVSSCGTKQSYIPSLPPLTRCNQGNRFLKAVRKVVPCHAFAEHPNTVPPNGDNFGTGNHHQPRPSTSRGTQRLYIRLNTLYYLLSQLNTIHKTIRCHHQSHQPPRRFPTASSHFDLARATINAATHHVAEVAAYRLIFHDSNAVFYEGLYIDLVSESRIRPALRALKQNLALLGAIMSERAREGAVREIMKASFDAFLMVLLAGGRERAFQREDVETVKEDFRALTQLFLACGWDVVTEEVVEREAEVVKGVLELMGEPTDQLVEDFSVLACESSGLIMSNFGGQQRVPMPPTTGRWNRVDPNTILRVICHRNDKTANGFLKKNFQMARRK